MRTLTTRLERLERRQAVAVMATQPGAIIVEQTPEHQAEVLHILCACGVFALSSDPTDLDAHSLQATSRTALQAHGVLDDDGYLVPGVAADAFIA